MLNKPKKVTLTMVSPTHRESALVVHQRAMLDKNNNKIMRLRIALDGTAKLANIYLPESAITKQKELYRAMVADEFHIVEVTFDNLKLYQNQYCIYGYADSYIILEEKGE